MEACLPFLSVLVEPCGEGIGRGCRRQERCSHIFEASSKEQQRGTGREGVQVVTCRGTGQQGNMKNLKSGKVFIPAQEC